MDEQTPTRVRIRPVSRSCSGCPIQDRARPAGLCSLCCTLVADRDGGLWVSLTPLDAGNGWQSIEVSRLSRVPHALAVG